MSEHASCRKAAKRSCQQVAATGSKYRVGVLPSPAGEDLSRRRKVFQVRILLGD